MCGAVCGAVCAADCCVGCGGTPAGDEQVTDFASLVREAAGGAIETLETAERETVKAAAGTGDINELVTAMAEAEITLQTVMAVRDRVISAYQEILRMPI